MINNSKMQIVSGFQWSFLDTLFNSGTSFFVGVILARILSPREFGIIGLITIIVSISNSLIDSGFSQALIRKKSVSEHEYTSVFFFNLFVSFFLYLLLYAFTPNIAHFFHQPVLKKVIPVLCSVILVNALGIIQRTILIRNIDFRTQTIISIISVSISSCTSIVLAILGYGVWSLVFLTLVRQFLQLICLWVSSKWKPKAVFSFSHISVLFNFGWKLLIAGLIETVYKEIYSAIIGKNYSAYTVGFYVKAQQFNSIFSNAFAMVIQKVSYPYFSRIEHDETQLNYYFKRIFRFAMIFSFILNFLIFSISDSIIKILLGNIWMESAQYLRILCFAGALYPLHILNLNLLNVKGRSDFFLMLEIIKKIIAIPIVIIGIHTNIKILLYGVVLNSFISVFINSVLTGKYVKFSTKEQVKSILFFYIISVGIGAIVYNIQFILNVHIIYLFVIQIMIYTLLTILIYFIFIRKDFYDIVSMLCFFINRIRGRYNV